MTLTNKLAGDRLHRGVGVALWRQVADGIRRGIGNDLADQTGRLPSEAELAQRFGVNRHTLRAAIAALTQEGVLRSEQGRGTFVRRVRRLSYPIGARTRFSAGLAGQTQDRGMVLLSHDMDEADDAKAEALDVPVGRALIRLQTLGQADGIAVSRAVSWFDAERFPTIAEVYGRLGSITQALGELGVDDYTRAWTRIEARHSDEADTRDLKLSAGAIVLYTTAVNIDRDGKPIQFSITRFAADRVELLVSAAF